MDVDEAAGTLYGLSPDEFVAARNELAAQARAAGDRAAAQTIKSLAKPSQPAWQVNLLVRDDPGAVTDLASVATALRAAAEAGDAAGLRRADAERRATLARLADRAGELALEAGKATTPAVRREVEATLQAAITSAEAAERVASGRLTAALFDTGLDALGMLTLAPAPPSSARRQDVAPRRSPAGPRPEASAAPSSGPQPSVDTSDDSEALAALERATEALTAARAAADRAQAYADQLAEEVTQVRARLAAVQSRAEDARQEAESAHARAAAARAARDEAQHAYDAARPQS